MSRYFIITSVLLFITACSKSNDNIVDSNLHSARPTTGSALMKVGDIQKFKFNCEYQGKTFKVFPKLPKSFISGEGLFFIKKEDDFVKIYFSLSSVSNDNWQAYSGVEKIPIGMTKIIESQVSDKKVLFKFKNEDVFIFEIIEKLKP